VPLLVREGRGQANLGLVNFILLILLLGTYEMSDRLRLTQPKPGPPMVWENKKFRGECNYQTTGMGRGLCARVCTHHKLSYSLYLEGLRASSKQTSYTCCSCFFCLARCGFRLFPSFRRDARSRHMLYDIHTCKLHDVTLPYVPELNVVHKCWASSTLCT
jgi:hypothetical protein